jgi:phage/plasmid-associated DNA primase
MPVIQDTSKAVTDRLILIDFPRRFEEDQQDKSLLARLTSPEEIEGILVNWAIPGLQSLMESKQFDVPERSDELLREYSRLADRFLEFADEHIEVVPDGFVTRRNLHQSYLNWCQDQGIRQPMTQTGFNVRVCEVFDLSKLQDHRAPGTKNRIWPGIRLKNLSKASFAPRSTQVKPAS